MMRLPTLAELASGDVTAKPMTEAELPRLTPLETAFVRELLLNPNNATRAAIRAGYAPKSADSAAAQVKARPEVKAHLDFYRAQDSERFNVTRQRIIEELAAVAFTNPTNFVRLNEHGEPDRVDFSELSPAEWASVAEFTVEDFKEGRGEDARDVRRVKYKHHPKLEAIKQLVTLLGLNEPEKVKLEVAGNGGGPVITANMTAQEAAEVYAKLREA